MPWDLVELNDSETTTACFCEFELTFGNFVESVIPSIGQVFNVVTFSIQLLIISFF